MPRTITSSAAARPARLGTGTSRLSSTASAPSSANNTQPKKSKLGLGAAKTKPVDFAQAERKALEEAEKIKQLGYDRQREEVEEKLRSEAAAAKRANEIEIKTNPTAASSKSATSQSTTNAQKPTAFPRFGFGAIPGAGAAAAAAVAASPAPSRSRYILHSPRSSEKNVLILSNQFNSTVDDSPTTARDKFGGQKAISSDMYFGRGSYDPDAAKEAQTRLRDFTGATAISSNQYFGREEEEESDRAQFGGHDGNLLGDGSLAGLEIAAKDAIAKVLANPDVQQVGESIRAGALKVSLVRSIICGLY